jgi:Tfp pilus assembly protein PilF
MIDDTLKLILGYRERAQSIPQDKLGRLFDRLSGSGLLEADAIESAIWREWMSYVDADAAEELELATQAILHENFTEAEQRLDALVHRAPDYAEAWNKRATLYFLTEREDLALADLRRVLALEPRHFGAMCHFAQIRMQQGDRESALYALDVALRLNPHLDEARTQGRKLMKQSARVLQ